MSSLGFVMLCHKSLHRAARGDLQPRLHLAQVRRGLASVYDGDVEGKVRDVYRRDYVHFGLGRRAAP